MRIYLGDIWKYNSRVFQWTLLNTRGPAPSPRAQHAAVMLMSKNKPFIFIYGGVTNTGVLDDMYMYSILSNTWNVVPGIQPGQRSQHFMLSMGSFPVKAVMFGGVKFFSTASSTLYYYQDIWEFDSNTYTWQNITYATPSFLTINTFQQTASLYSTASSDVIYSFGGRVNNSHLSSILYSVNLGCPPGMFSPSFSTELCRPCPYGSYSDQMGASSCKMCGASVTTTKEGATLPSDCSVCAKGACQYGHCSVVNNQFSCVCDPLILGERCDNDLNRNIVISITTIIPVVSLLVFLGLRWYRRWRDMKLLSENNPFQIEYSSIQLAEMLGKGSFGTVSSLPFAYLSLSRHRAWLIYMYHS